MTINNQHPPRLNHPSRIDHDQPPTAKPSTQIPAQTSNATHQQEHHQQEPHQHHQHHQHPSQTIHPSSSFSTLNQPHHHHHASQLIARPLTPLISLAAYGSLLITAFSALFGLILASYGLSAWDDAKIKFFGFRHMIGKGLGAGKELVGAVTSTTFLQPEHGAKTSIPRRAHPHHHSSSGTTLSDQFTGGESDKTTKRSSGYELPNDEQDQGIGTSNNSTKGNSIPEHPSSPSRPTTTTFPTTKTEANPSSNPSSTLGHEPRINFPPRPPLSVLIVSLFLTLIVLAARLVIVWWMGQQTQKNSTQAFKNAQRAYQAANTTTTSQDNDRDDDKDKEEDRGNADHLDLPNQHYRRHHSSIHPIPSTFSTSTFSTNLSSSATRTSSFNRRTPYHHHKFSNSHSSSFFRHHTPHQT